MDYFYFIDRMTGRYSLPMRIRSELVSLVDTELTVQGAQLICTQNPDREHRFFPRDFLFVGMTSDLPADPARAPHDCVCIYDEPLPPAYLQGEEQINLLVLHVREPEDALLLTLNHASFLLADDFRYYRGMERIAAARARGADLAEAMALIQTLVSNPVLLVDDQGHVLGTGDDAFSSEVLQAQIRSGRLTPAQLQELRQNSVYEPLRSQYRQTSQALAWGYYRYLCVPIRVRGLRVAELLSQNYRTAFHYSTIQLMEPIAALLAEVLSRRMEEENHRSLLHSLLFAELLRATPDQTEALQQRIRELRWRQEPGMQLLVCQGPEEAFVALRQQTPDARWTAVEDRWLLLCDPDPERTEEMLAERLAQLGLCGGLSWPFDTLLALPAAYVQASTALSMGSGTLRRYASVFAEHVFSLSPAEALPHLHPAVARLEAYDQTHDGNLLPTLEGYLSGPQQPAEVAAQLFISRSTLFYRLNRIRELGGVELNNGEECMNLLLSLRLYRRLNWLV